MFILDLFVWAVRRRFWRPWLTQLIIEYISTVFVSWSTKHSYILNSNDSLFPIFLVHFIFLCCYLACYSVKVRVPQFAKQSLAQGPQNPTIWKKKQIYTWMLNTLLTCLMVQGPSARGRDTIMSKRPKCNPQNTIKDHLSTAGQKTDCLSPSTT